MRIEARDDDALIDRLCRSDEELLRAVYEKIGEVAREKDPELPAAAFDEAGAEERHSVGLFAAAIVRALEPFRASRLSADHTGVLVEAMRELLSGHDNLYVAHFGPDSDPCIDIAAMPARELLGEYRNALAARGEQSPDASGGE